MLVFVREDKYHAVSLIYQYFARNQMFQGSMVALVTPMQDDGSVDFSALDKLLDFHLDNGTNAIVSMGTTGESATLNMDEHCGVIKHTVDFINGRIPVIAGTGANSTSEAIELTAFAAQAGANACLLVTPYYNKPTQEGLYLHYRAVAEAVAVPQILYNVPGRTCCDMLPATVARLSAIDNIIGIKEATGDMGRAREIMDSCQEDFEIYSGDDDTAVEMMLIGGKGNISVTANVAPAMMSQMCAAALTGDKQTALKINDQLQALHTNLFIETSPIPVKWALAKMGLIGAGIRLPLTPLSDDKHDAICKALRAADVLN